MATLKRAGIALVLAAFVCSGYHVWAGEEDVEKARDAKNAALIYWRAFAEIPHVPKEHAQMMRSCDPVQPGPEAANLASAWDGALRLLQRGAAIHDCNWGFDFSIDGPLTLLSHVGKARQLARGARFRARYRWALGKKSEAVQDLRTSVILARHVGAGGREGITSMVLQIGIEEMSIKVAARHLTDTEAADALAVMVEDLSRMPESLAKNSFLAEKAVVAWFRREMQKKEPEMTFEDFCEDYGVDVTLIAPIPKEMTVSKLLGLLDETEKRYEEAAELMQVPPDQFESASLAFEKKVSGNVFSNALVRGLPKVRNFVMRLETKWAMLAAAIALYKEGAKALSSVKDPYGDGPFEYRKWDGGFELSSKLTYDDKPVSLTFGKPPAE